MFAVACGGPVPDAPPILTIGPDIGHIREAVEHIESRTCTIFQFVEHNPDITVNYDQRDCGAAGAGYGRVSIPDPQRCGWVYDGWGVGLEVHELIHVLGHWHHDKAKTDSVMAPGVRWDWEIWQEDIEFIMEGYCDEQ